MMLPFAGVGISSGGLEDDLEDAIELSEALKALDLCFGESPILVCSSESLPSAPSYAALRRRRCSSFSRSSL